MSILARISDFLDTEVLSGKFLEKGSWDSEYVKECLEELRGKIIPFTNNQTFQGVMRTPIQLELVEGRYHETTVVNELNIYLTGIVENEISNQTPESDISAIALFLHALTHTTGVINAEVLLVSIADLLIMYMKCKNTQLATELLKLGKLFLTASIVIDGNNSCYHTCIQHFIDPLIGDCQLVEIDFEGINAHLIEGNQNLPQGYNSFKTLPIDFTIGTQEELTKLELLFISFSSLEVMQKCFKLETKAARKIRINNRKSARLEAVS
jgi:hypothetical protein